MRVTIRINDQLHAKAKKWAVEQGTTLTALIEGSLRAALPGWKPAYRGNRFRMITFRGEGGQPGVDLNDSASLLDRMEGVKGVD